MSDVRDFYRRFSISKPPDRHVNTITSLEEFKGNAAQRILLGKRLAHLSTQQKEALFKSKMRYGIW